MPLYQYKCSNCNHSFDAFKKIVDRDEPCEIPCSECSEIQIKKVIGAPGRADTVSLGLVQPDSDWKTFIRELDRKNPGNTINNVW
jgi:putative FmdB family regulatory protein